MAKPLVEVAITADGKVFVREVAKATDATKKFEKSTKDTDAAVKKLGADFDKIGGQIGGSATRAAKYLAGMGVAAVAMGAALVKAGLQSGDVLAKTSDKLGVTTESFARLSYAAKMAGVEQSQLDAGLRKLSRSLIDAESGSKASALAFSTLGLKTSDLLKLTPDKQFEKISDALMRVENTSQRAAVAQQIFGRAGASMINLAKTGSEGLAELAHEADVLGLSLSRIEARQIEIARDAIERLHQGTVGLGQQLAVSFAPLLQDIADRLFGITEQAGGMRMVAEQAFNSVTNAAALFADVMQRLNIFWVGAKVGITEFMALVVKMYEITAHPFDTMLNGFSEFSRALDAQGVALREELAAMQAQEPASVRFLERLRNLQREQEKAARDAVGTGKAAQGAFIETADAADKASKKVEALANSTTNLLDKMSDYLTGIQQAAEAANMSDRDRARFEARNRVAEFYKDLTVQLAAAKKALTTATNAESAAIQEQIDQLQTAVDGFDAYRQAVDQATQQQFDAEAKTKATTAALKEQAKEVDPWAEALTGAVERIDSAFVDMWRNVGDGFDSFADNLKTAFKDLLAELAHLAITRPIVMSIAGALGLGGSGNALASGGGGLLGGGGGGFGLGDIGSIFSIGSGVSKFMGGFANGGGVSGGLSAMFGGSGGAFGSMLSSGGAQFYGALSDLGGSLGIKSLQDAGFNQMTNYMEGSFGQNLTNIGTNLIAGYAGSLAGNWIGSNVLTDGRQAQSSWGSMAGGLVGSAWGPIGTAIGSAIGSLVDVAFGTDDTKRVRLGITAGQYNTPSNLTESLRGSSGLLLQSEHNRTDDNGAAAKSMMESFLAIDDALTSISRLAGATVDLSNAKLKNPDYLNNNHVQAGFFGTAENNQFNQSLMKNATRDFINSWLNEIKDQLPERVRVVMGAASKATAEQLLSIYGSIVDLDRLLNLDVLQTVAEQAEAASASILDVYREATEKVTTLAGEYDGTAESLQALTAALADQKNVAAALAEQYRQLAEIVNSSFANSIAQIEESLLSTEQLYGLRRDQIAEMTTELAATIDPARIAELTSQINAAALSAWNILDETQRTQLGQEFVGFLNQAKDIASGQVAAGQSSLSDTESTTKATIDAQLMNSAAIIQQQASTEFAEAVREFGGYMANWQAWMSGTTWEVR